MSNPEKRKGTMKTYTKEQRDYMRHPKAMKSGDWFYIGCGECSFHNAKHGGEGVTITTRQLVKALRKAGVIP